MKLTEDILRIRPLSTLSYQTFHFSLKLLFYQDSITILENYLAVAGEVELLVPVIREACATAGESVREHIRIEGLTGTQLLSAVEELKEEKNQCEEADSSKVDADRRGSDESVEKLLAEADAKSIQLQKQLEDLQRKISRSMNVKESVREQLAEVLDRLNSSVSLIEKGGVCGDEKEPEHKQSIGSVLSFEVTGGDIEHARKISTSGELTNRTESRLSFGMDMDDELYQLYCDTSRLLGRPCKTLADCNNAETVVVNKGLLLEVIDCARILLTDKSGEVDNADDQTLKSEMKESDQEGNKSQNRNEEEEDEQHEKGEEGAGLSIQKEGENEEKEDENEEVLPDDEGEKEKTTEEAERDEKSDSKTGPDEDEPVAQVKRLGADQAVNPADQPTLEQQTPDEQEKSPTDEDQESPKEGRRNAEAEDHASNEDISSSDGKGGEASITQELPESSRQPPDLPSPSNEAGKDEAEHELVQTDDAETEFTDDGHEVSSTQEEETATTENRVKRNSAAASQSKGEDPSRATVMKTLPPYEFAHKYHIQSHLNTATTTSVVQQPVPLQRNRFCSPTMSRKSVAEGKEKDTEKETKRQLLQPRFVF
ncbi:unnamed protein product [Nippostrongylus brasiliensis]|uniref:BRCT domain-containing protein n=1 Tax=Nippostrongylus brasiliensis TaxID=27835 RepID=A0A0N4XC77_NIPBR|nr:unnamed protein product [Nippostrongylus brasiliensis]